MEREKTVEEIGRLRVSAIIRTDSRSAAANAMAAAVRGGFRIVEFTLTTPGALELIQEFAADRNLIVGAGTVLTPRDAARAVEAGARFIVSPVVDAEVIAEASRLDVACIPGTFTPTEMLHALRSGADIVKLFPAPADVVKYVTQVRGPLPQLKIFPTAGVDEENFVAILGAGAFGVGFVAPLFPAAEVRSGDFAAIQARANRIMEMYSKAEASARP